MLFTLTFLNLHFYESEGKNHYEILIVKHDVQGCGQSLQNLINTVK